MKTTPDTGFLLFLFLFFIHSYTLHGQVSKLIGIIDNQLVDINPNDGSIHPIRDVDLLEEPSNLVYSNDDCLFYTLINTLQAPTLVSIDWQGRHTVIGLLSLNGRTIHFTEGLALDAESNKLYVAASLNGSIADQDYSSEALLEVNTSNAVCTLTSTITPGGTQQTDMDDLLIVADQLYIHDGSPGPALSHFYRADIQSINPNFFSPSILLSNSYLSSRDLGVFDNLIYITTLDRELHVINIATRTLELLSITHTASEYNGEPIRGLSNVEIPTLEVLNVDTVLCDDQSITLSINLPNAEINWNTGEIGSSINVNTSGEYWADIFVDDQCWYRSDTAIIEQQSCDTCFLIGQEIDKFLFLGNDTLICIGDELDLSLELDDRFSIFWNHGSNNTMITTQGEGTYWANILYGDCAYTSDTLNLEQGNCSPCQYFIPNVFTPQGDGVNDIFKVFFAQDCDVVSIKMSIFDRWGNLLHISHNNEWDGNSNGEPLGNGVFVYLIEITSSILSSNTSVIESGNITLIR